MNEPLDEDSGMLSYEDAFAIAEKVTDMADRVRTMHQMMPGAQAKSGFELDGTEFEITISVRRTLNKDHTS